MIKLTYPNFKFPVFYFFPTGNETAAGLALLVIRVVTQLQLINFRIQGRVCDAPAKHRNLFRLLGATLEEPSVFIHGGKIYVFLDPPHLILERVWFSFCMNKKSKTIKIK